MSEKTPEQLAAEAAAADQAKKDAEAQKAAEKAAKAEARAEAKRLKEEEAAAKKAAREAEKAEKKAAAEAAKAQKAAEKEAEKARKLAEKEANKMPEQNGIRRPKPHTLCGQAWAIFDQLSAERGSPTPIAPAMEIAMQQNLNEANVRAEYARWRKFFGVSGRIVDAPEKPAESEPAPTAE